MIAEGWSWGGSCRSFLPTAAFTAALTAPLLSASSILLLSLLKLPLKLNDLLVLLLEAVIIATAVCALIGARTLCKN